MNFLLWIIFGGLAGWLASVLVGNDAGLGLIGNIVVGILGAVIGGWMLDQMGVGGSAGAERPTTVYSFVAAVAGAVILLVVLNLLF